MDRKMFYVSVQGRSVLDDPEATSYEWVIRATPEEADSIRYKLQQLGEKEESTFLAYTFPWPDSPEDVVNHSYQSVLDGLYREIYRLGTEETRQLLQRVGYEN
ncbi:hypothetical protein [Paenibacillus aceti]|uniref:Hydrolase n=1 Tax=Paenibacillus aceti TaxID=1820010 RepID=A0ABQ1VS88_9BACL|nr:hypothetical protein [Paenibacillus aceti]GGF89546.1 hypothetical protein GCM10010913_08670 [Paenibacillus aceti]